MKTLQESEETMTGKFLNLEQTGKILNVTGRTIQNLIERGELRGFQVGARWRVEESDITAYIERQKQKASVIDAKQPGRVAEIDAYVAQIEDLVKRDEMREVLMHFATENHPSLLTFTEREEVE